MVRRGKTVGGYVVYDIKCDYTTLQYINTYNDIGRGGWHTAAVKENKRARAVYIPMYDP